MGIVLNKHKALSVFTLTMMNVIAVDSLRNLAVSAEYGASLVFFYAVAALVFYIPSILIGAELATGWPQTGGAYIWIREAFGQHWGFLGMWLQWSYNVVWYPTILSFIVGTLAAVLAPSLATNNYYMLAAVLVLYWGMTLLNCLGIRVSAKISVSGAVLGTLMPMGAIIVLGVIWLSKGNAMQIPLTWQSMLPTTYSMGNLAFLIGIIFSLMGMEMSAVHAGDAVQPEKNYPKALLYSAIIIWFSLVFSSLAIALVIPHQELNLVSGLVDAFAVFLKSYHLSGWLPVMVLAIVFGCLSGVSTWIVGPSRGLLIAARECGIMRRLHFVNAKGAPAKILVFQACVFTLLCSAFLLMPSVNSSYWVLVALTSQLALLYYILLFAAAIRLRYCAPLVKRHFQIPGGKAGMWVVVVTGIVFCLGATCLGFQPPKELNMANLFYYDAFLLAGLTVFCGFPFLLIQRAKRLKRKIMS